MPAIKIQLVGATLEEALEKSELKLGKFYRPHTIHGLPNIQDDVWEVTIELEEIPYWKFKEEPKTPLIQTPFNNR